MKNVLIVDDEEAFILSIGDGLEKYSSDFNVLTAENGKAAVDVLESRKIDLVVTDLSMPQMDGFELLAYINNNFPSIPAIVLSAYGTPIIKNRLKTLGPLRYFLEKPVDLKTLATAIMGCLKEASKGGFVKSISIGSFLQLIQMEQKTCILEIYQEGGAQKGFFYFIKGELHNAVYGDTQGEKVAREMITWDNAEIRFRDLPLKEYKIKKRISTELMSLIMDAARIKDESPAIKESRKEPGPDDTIEIEIEKLENDEEEFTLDMGRDVEASLTSRKAGPKDVKEDKGEIKKTKKRIIINVKKLKDSIEILKRNLGESLLAIDIFTSNGEKSLAGYNTNQQACALFNQLTGFLKGALKKSEFPGLGKYYILDLADGKMIIVIPFGECQCGMLVDRGKTQLGLLLNVVIPQIISALEKAITRQDV
jgi:CheY-like chemotaxis protein